MVRVRFSGDRSQVSRYSLQKRVTLLPNACLLDDTPVPATLHGTYRAWQRARRGKKPSANQLVFASRWADRLHTLTSTLRAGAWQPARTVSFVVTHPKTREIHAPDFADRVVHHWLVPQLEALYEPIFIHHSYANRKGKGSHGAVDALQGMMRSVQARHPVDTVKKVN
jgi:RNA-directed DNA polymerase